MASDMHASTRSKQQRVAEQRVTRAGYAKGGRVKSDVPDGDEKQDAAMVAKGVHQHEAHDHPGKTKTKLRLRRGGSVDGGKAQRRTDKAGRGKGNITLVIQNSNPAERQQAAMKGMQAGAQLGARKAAAGMMAQQARPAPAINAGGMPPGRVPPQAPPMAGGAPGMPPRPQMVRRGGRIVTVREHKRRLRGGAV